MECFLSNLNVSETAEDIRNTLSECGCCTKCILRFLGVKNYLVYSSLSNAEQHLESICASSDHCTDDELPSKKLKTLEGCTSCLGILRGSTSESSIKNIASEVKAENYDAASFLVSVSGPVCLQLRQFSVLLHLRDKYPVIYNDLKLENIPQVKEVWKWSIGCSLEKELGIKFSAESPFEINVTFDYKDDVKECGELSELNCNKETKKLNNKKSSKDQKQTQWSRAGILTMLNSSDAKLINRPPRHPETSCSIKSIACSHSAVYLGGRYNKYSRNLSQTPWLVDGQKHAKTSVQELICQYIYPCMNPDDIIFSAAGREDIDVRTLGRGRPFVLQILNPRHSQLTPEEIKEINNKINKGCPEIAVRDLQIVSKNDFQKLKEGEETKKKSYMALCYSSSPVSQPDMILLSQTKELLVKQKSPIRVLHRRSAAVRDKIIHSMRAELVDDHHFRLYLHTQAGTYIKEFVHGDFGRTTPNIGTLIKKDIVDILELDVESVELDWPPQLD